MNQNILAIRQRQVLYDKKWKKFLKRAWLFRYIPFVELVMAAGSMATGNVREESDFDVIIGVRLGRIFTARFFCVLAFEIFGWRRHRPHGAVNELRSYADASVEQFTNSSTHKLINSQTADRLCLNHFVTPASYRLSPPHNAYWQNLYKNLVPLFGAREKIHDFWRANADWLGEEVGYTDDLRWHSPFAKGRRPLAVKDFLTGSYLARFGEFLLRGKMGDWLERLLKKLQIVKIERSLSTSLGYKPRIIYNDSELEFHPDTTRTEKV